jgi:hypothetical protein
MAAVSELVSGLDAELVRLGYKPSTLVWYRVAGGVWRGISRRAAFRSSRWMSRWPGSMRRAAVSLRRSKPAR